MQSTQVHSSIQTVINLAKQIKEYFCSVFLNRPFLVYTYIHEELLYNIGHKTELQEQSYFMVESRKQLEERLRKESIQFGKLVW